MDSKTANAVADIYRFLPGKNCGECGHERCAELAKEILIGTKNVYDCPYMEDEKRQAAILVIEEHFRF